MDKKQKRNKLIISAIAGGTIVAAGAGGALAYFTDNEKTINTFTIGDVSIEGIEPHYPGDDSDEVKDIVPNKEVLKDPIVSNNGINDAIVFMTVDSPLERVTVVNDDGSTAEEKGINEIFWYKQSTDEMSAHENNFSWAWKRLPDKEMFVKISADGSEFEVQEEDLEAAYDLLEDGESLVKRYVFGYRDPIQGSSETDGTPQTGFNMSTTSLFGKVQLKNVIENEIDEAVEKIIIRSYAIQSDKILENDVDLTEELSDENLGKIYDIFIRQNSIEDDNSGLKVEGLRDADSIEETSNGASGTTDPHKNRFDTNDDVSESNVNPRMNEDEVDPEDENAWLYGTWYSIDGRKLWFKKDGSCSEGTYQIGTRDGGKTYGVSFEAPGYPVGALSIDMYSIMNEEKTMFETFGGTVFKKGEVPSADEVSVLGRWYDSSANEYFFNPEMEYRYYDLRDKLIDEGTYEKTGSELILTSKNGGAKTLPYSVDPIKREMILDETLYTRTCPQVVEKEYAGEYTYATGSAAEGTLEEHRIYVDPNGKGYHTVRKNGKLQDGRFFTDYFTNKDGFKYRENPLLKSDESRYALVWMIDGENESPILFTENETVSDLDAGDKEIFLDKEFTTPAEPSTPLKDLITVYLK